MTRAPGSNAGFAAAGDSPGGVLRWYEWARAPRPGPGGMRVGPSYCGPLRNPDSVQSGQARVNLADRDAGRQLERPDRVGLQVGPEHAEIGLALAGRLVVAVQGRSVQVHALQAIAEAPQVLLGLYEAGVLQLTAVPHVVPVVDRQSGAGFEDQGIFVEGRNLDEAIAALQPEADAGPPGVLAQLAG